MDSRWKPIKPLDPSVPEQLGDDLAALDGLQRRWTELAAFLDEADRLSLGRRTLRRHAMETGILERLYVIPPAHTVTLVEEGFSKEALAKTDWELPQDTALFLNAQLRGLEMVCDYVRDGFHLTTSFVKALHSVITQPQTTYDATDSLGRPTRAKMTHGAYKTLPNNVKRADGSLLEFAPPEQVPGEVENLVDWYNRMHAVHPLVSAAWLHHRFVQIHPFQDGNGRVARALNHYSALRRDYMPVTVDRHNRENYLLALDTANDGNLAPLTLLFVELTKRSLHHEIAKLASGSAGPAPWISE